MTEALRLQQFIVRLKPFEPFIKLFFDADDGFFNSLARRRIVAGRENRQASWLLQNLARQRINSRESLDLIAKKLHPHRRVLPGWENIYHVAAYPESAARKINIITLILNISQQADELILHPPLADCQLNRHISIRLRRTDAVNAADARHDDNIAPGQ